MIFKSKPNGPSKATYRSKKISSYANGTYYILRSTNVALPLSNWQPIATNNFDANGNFSFSSPVDPATPKRFFTMQVP